MNRTHTHTKKKKMKEKDLMRRTRGYECFAFFLPDIYCVPLETIRSD